MAQDEAPKEIPDPYSDAAKQATEAGKLLDLIRNSPEEAAKLGIGAAGMRREQQKPPEPLSKSIEGPISLTHVMDAIGRTEEQNRQIIEMLKNQGGAVF